MIVRYRPASETDLYWMQNHLRFDMTRRTKGIAVVDGNNRLIGGCVFENWTYTGGEIHVIITNTMVLRHRFIEEMLGYFFETCDRRVLWCTVLSTNEKCLKFVRHIGFQEILRIKDGYDEGTDLITHELRKENCRWIEHGQARRTGSSRL